MKETIKASIAGAVAAAYKNGLLPSAELPVFEVEEPRIRAHGDFATNVAMTGASVYKMAPRAVADIIIRHLVDTDNVILKTEIAGPGFINFFLNINAWLPLLDAVHTRHDFGACDLGRGRKIMVEFVSANPTGPLHVGHGRGAAVGDSLANILSFCGWQVQKEYYVNDAGNQMMTLGKSVYLRWRQSQGETIDFPDDCYQGEYIHQLAEAVAGSVPDFTRLDEQAAIKACTVFAAGSILDGIRHQFRQLVFGKIIV